MLQNLTKEVRFRTRAALMLPSIRAIGLAIAVGIAYFVAAQLSLALLAEPDGVAVFWPAAGVSSGILIALGRAARLPVVSGVMVATSSRPSWFRSCCVIERLLEIPHDIRASIEERGKAGDLCDPEPQRTKPIAHIAKMTATPLLPWLTASAP
jgi:hypothetical protein